MQGRLKEQLRRGVSPQNFQRMSFSWWLASQYLPLRVSSTFRNERPRISAYPQSSWLADRIAGVNASRPTAMCRVMRWHGSDKGNWVWHNYTTVYSTVFESLENKPLRIFELGLGSNNPEFGANMGAHGKPGASLRGWRDLFPQAAVFGADIDRRSLFTEDRIATFYCDQLDVQAIQALWSQPALREGMDILVDDGIHTLEGSICFLDASLGRLRPGGIYVIEDIQNKVKARWLDLLAKTYSVRYPDHEFVFVELPLASNDFDNNLLLIRRKP